MRRRTIWAGALIAVVGLAWAAKTEVVKRSQVPVWAGKGSSYGKVFMAKSGDELEVLAEEENEWMKVKLGDKTGYVRKPAIREQSGKLVQASGDAKADKTVLAAAGKGLGDPVRFAEARKLNFKALNKLKESSQRVAGEPWQSFTAEGNLAPNRK